MSAPRRKAKQNKRSHAWRGCEHAQTQFTETTTEKGAPHPVKVEKTGRNGENVEVRAGGEHRDPGKVEITPRLEKSTRHGDKDCGGEKGRPTPWKKRSSKRGNDSKGANRRKKKADPWKGKLALHFEAGLSGGKILENEARRHQGVEIPKKERRAYD